MTPTEIVHEICARFGGLVPKASWGETALFYNPGGLLVHGVYFCTLKQHDGANDRASHLDREGVFRVAIGLTPASYASMFGNKPARPAKGACAATGHDFTALNRLMPHPVYAWMGWAQILSPSRDRFEELLPLIALSHGAAVDKFNRKTAAKPLKSGKATL
jgi:hypothetical protein